jgi:hypothetical protein
VTVTGVGGVGKTRLAVQVAADLLPTSPTAPGCVNSRWRATPTLWPRWWPRRWGWCSGGPVPGTEHRGVHPPQPPAAGGGQL